MEKVYFYHLNIMTQQIKVEEFKVECIWRENNYHLVTKRNGKIFKMMKKINNLDELEVVRSGINISGCSYHKDKMNEFIAKCLPHVLDYRNNVIKNINLLLKSEENADKTLRILKEEF